MSLQRWTYYRFQETRCTAVSGYQPWILVWKMVLFSVWLPRGLQFPWYLDLNWALLSTTASWLTFTLGGVGLKSTFSGTLFDSVLKARFSWAWPWPQTYFNERTKITSTVLYATAIMVSPHWKRSVGVTKWCLSGCLVFKRVKSFIPSSSTCLFLLLLRPSGLRMRITCSPVCGVLPDHYGVFIWWHFLWSPESQPAPPLLLPHPALYPGAVNIRISGLHQPYVDYPRSGHLLNTGYTLCGPRAAPEVWSSSLHGHKN